MGFIFYDIETTGLDPAFDQIIHFAAIKTDYNLEEIDRFEIRSRLLPYVVPSPEAILVNRINIEQLTDPTLPSHYEMVRRIQHKLLEWSPSIFIGHNSIFFDENFLRQAFYQNLLPPYLTNTNKNSRSDSMRIFQAASLIAPGAVNIPIINNKMSFKLTHLAIENGIINTKSHSATHDANTLVHLCRLLIDRAPEIWSNFVRFAQKSSVLDFINGEDYFSLSDHYFSNPYSWLVTTLGENPDNKSEIFVFDLAYDPDEVASLDNNSLIQHLTNEATPIRKLRANACPMIFPEYEAPEIAKAKHLPESELERRSARINNDQSLSTRLISAYLSISPERTLSSYIEQQIYDQFIDRQNERLSAQFHKVSWTERLRILSSISDSRLKALGSRLIHAESPDILPAALRQQHEIATARRILGIEGNVPWTTLPKAIQKANDLLEQASDDDKDLLVELRDYLATWTNSAATMSD